MHIPQAPHATSGMQAFAAGPRSTVRSAARVVHARNPARVTQMNDAVSVHRAQMEASAALARQVGI